MTGGAGIETKAELVIAVGIRALISSGFLLYLLCDKANGEYAV
jgi:hypothetical protein